MMPAGGALFGPGSPVKPAEGSTLVFIGGRWEATATEVFTLAQNTAATNIPNASFPLGVCRGGQLDYVITRGAAITRKGTLQIAGDSASPSVSDSAASVGAAGITWSAVVSGSSVQVQIATDNVVATPIRLRWLMARWTEP